jgi:hypothetical protein
MNTQNPWQTARKILCVRLDNLGDVLMTTPALRALKAFNPQTQLTLLTSHMASDIAQYIPEIDAVIEFDVPWVKLEGQDGGGEAVLEFVARLKQAEFDAAIIFTVFSQNPLPAAMLCYPSPGYRCGLPAAGRRPTACSPIGCPTRSHLATSSTKYRGSLPSLDSSVRPRAAT